MNALLVASGISNIVIAIFINYIQTPYAYLLCISCDYRKNSFHTTDLSPHHALCSNTLSGSVSSLLPNCGLA